MSTKNWEFEEKSGWLRVMLKHSIDSFNFADFKKDFEEQLGSKAASVAFEVGNIKFMSLLAIQYICEVAQKLHGMGGRTALISPSEKLKRQIHIFADLSVLQVYRTAQNFSNDRPDPKFARELDVELPTSP